MKSIILLLLFSTFAHSQDNNFKVSNADYKVFHNPYYQLFDILDKNSVIIRFQKWNSSNFNDFKSDFIVIGSEKIYHVEFRSYLLPFENNDTIIKHEIIGKNKRTYQEILNQITDKKYVKALKQSDFEINYKTSKDDSGILICGSSHPDYYNIEIMKKNLIYSLSNISIEEDCGRSRKKLDLFLEFYKLIEDTWKIKDDFNDKSLKK